MKKNLFILSALGLSAASSLMLSACRDYEVMDEEVAKEIATKQEYYDNFVKEFGVPDPNHTWGWGGMTPEAADALLGHSTTRAEGDDYSKGGRVNVNRNQWTDSTDPTSLLNVYGVPGWPNWDGKYYTADGTYTNGHYTIHDSKQERGCNMPNDVTEFEILWVSNAVHYKQYTEVPLHISDYYIQEISTDGDYENNADYLAGTIKRYGKVSTRQEGYDNYKMDKLDAKSLGGEDTWTHINNFNASMNYQPHLHVGNNHDRNIIYVQSAGTESFRYHPSNSTNSKTYEKFILIELTWSEPLDPEWSTKMGSHTLADVLANPSLLGATKQRTGYYICFDFQDSKEEYGEYSGDDVYDNWILKLTPGYPVVKNRWPKRLMCEDLGNTFDFDFNDAVFDLSFAQNTSDPSGQTYDMIVVVQAAGGTMPIHVALTPSGLGRNMEIHHLLGDNPSTTPVNVIKKGAKAAPAMYRYKNAFTVDPTKVPMKDASYTDKEGVVHPMMVPSNMQNDVLLAQMAAAAFKARIYIYNTKESRWHDVSGYELYQGLRENYNDGVKPSENPNNVPQLFNCSADAKWTYESGHIKYAYKHFVDWVHEEQGLYRLRWDKDGYYKRGASDSDLPTIESNAGKAWAGSWDYGVAGATAWGLSSDFIDKSKCWGGSGAE